MLAVEKRLNQERGLLDKSLNHNLNAITSPPRPQGNQGQQSGKGRGGDGYGKGGSHQGGRGQGKAGSGGNSGGQAPGAEKNASKATGSKKRHRWSKQGKGGRGKGEEWGGKHVRFNACVVDIDDDDPPKPPKLAGAFPAQGPSAGYQPDPSRLKQVAPNTWVEE